MLETTGITAWMRAKTRMTAYGMEHAKTAMRFAGGIFLGSVIGYLTALSLSLNVPAEMWWAVAAVNLVMCIRAFWISTFSPGGVEMLITPEDKVMYDASNFYLSFDTKNGTISAPIFSKTMKVSRRDENGTPVYVCSGELHEDLKDILGSLVLKNTKNCVMHFGKLNMKICPVKAYHEDLIQFLERRIEPKQEAV